MQHLSATCAGVATMLKQDIAIDDGVLDTAGGHHQTAPATRQIETHFTSLVGADRGEIENREISRQAFGNTATLSNPK